jgi:P-type Cu+ transporter
MTKCPTCGMEVDEKNAAAKPDYKGETYYFCSSNCKVAFDKNPQSFVDKAKTGAHEHVHKR